MFLLDKAHVSTHRPLKYRQKKEICPHFALETSFFYVTIVLWNSVG